MLSAAANERIEVARVLEVTEYEWGVPRLANAKIKEIIERETERDLTEAREETEEQPKQDENPAINTAAIPKAARPSSIPSVWRDGKAHLDTSNIQSDLSEILAREERDALAAEFQSLIDAPGVASNHDQRACDYLKETLELLPAGAPTSAELFRLTRREQTLIEMAATVNEEWPDVEAAQFRALLAGLTDYLNLFPLRRKRRRIDLSGILEDVSGNEVRIDLTQTNEDLRTETAIEVVDEAIPAAVDRIIEEVPASDEPLEGTGLDAAIDAYDGINATAITLARNASSSPAAVEVLKELQPQTPDEALAFAKGYHEKRVENYEKLGRAQGDAETAVSAGGAVLRNRERLLGWIPKLFKKSDPGDTGT